MPVETGRIPSTGHRPPPSIGLCAKRLTGLCANEGTVKSKPQLLPTFSSQWNYTRCSVTNGIYLYATIIVHPILWLVAE